jgi:hypothetical protein
MRDHDPPDEKSDEYTGTDHEPDTGTDTPQPTPARLGNLRRFDTVPGGVGRLRGNRGTHHGRAIAGYPLLSSATPLVDAPLGCPGRGRGDGHAVPRVRPPRSP